MSDGEYGLLDVEEADAPGDEFEEIDVEDTETDTIARRRDREFDEFRKRIKDADQFKVTDSVFDDATYGALYDLVQAGHVTAFGGPISTGKEASVFSALGPDETELAVKIYRINASDFRDMRNYLAGDPRFEGLGSDKKATVLAWVRKEFGNIQRAREAGVRVPEPIAVERNVLVMEYLGTEAGRAKRLSEIHLENPRTAYEVVREYMRRLNDAGLIHGDLSEYNLVVQGERIYVIDLGQAVTVHNPNAETFLDRDCENVASYFSRQGLDVDAERLRRFVTRADEDEESDDGENGDDGADAAAGRDGEDGNEDREDGSVDGEA